MVVAGGAGEVGEGVVHALLRAGATVIAPSRSPEKIDGLRGTIGSLTGGHLITPEIDIGTPSGLAALTSVVDGQRRLDAVVSSIGSFWQGPGLFEVEPKVFRDSLEARVFPHLGLIQTLVWIDVQIGILSTLDN